MNIFTKILIGIAIVLMTSCQEYGIQLRIQNDSQLDFDKVSVNNVPFGALRASEISSYIPFESIYATEFIEVLVDSKLYKVIPEDYDADEFYEQGNFRYVLDVSDSDQLRIRFVPE